MSVMTRSIRSDLDRAIEILKEEGCDEVYLYGSIAEGRFDEKSDLDLAVKGIPSGDFFRVLGRLMLELDHPVDLVDLDKDKDFSKFLKEEGELVQAS